MLLSSLAKSWDAMHAQGMTGVGPARQGSRTLVPDLWSACYNVSHRIVISKNGDLIRIDNIRDEIQIGGKKGKPKTISLPKRLILPGITTNRTNSIASNFLWDKAEYLIGYPSLKDQSAKEKPQRPDKRSLQCFEQAMAFHIGHQAAINDPSYDAVCHFYQKWHKELIKVQNHDADSDDLFYPGYIGPRQNLPFSGQAVFQVDGDLEDVYERPACQKFWQENYHEVCGDEDSTPVIGQCLVDGSIAPLARIHKPSIVGLGADDGLKIVSCAISSANSHGMEKGYNSPVSIENAFKYATALNYYLTDGDQSIKIGNFYVAFWAEQPSVGTAEATALFSEMVDPSYDQEGVNEDIKQRLQAISEGYYPDGLCTAETPFCVVGLLPRDKGRVSVRFFHRGTFGDIFQRMAQYYKDLKIRSYLPSERERGSSAYRFQSVLSAIPEKEREIFSTKLLESILTGTRYPYNLYCTLVDRCGIPGLSGDANLMPQGAIAFIKAYLNQLFRTTNRKEFSMTLDQTRPEGSYSLGRLFAVLQKIQYDKDPSIGGTIKKKYGRQAMRTPNDVFSKLLPAAEQMLDVLDDKRRIFYSKLIRKLVVKACPPGSQTYCFPKILRELDQGTFLIGYYHQWARFFRKRKPTTTA